MKIYPLKQGKEQYGNIPRCMSKRVSSDHMAE